MDHKEKLLAPFHTTGLSLRNRVVMAPMSRRRSPAGIPNDATRIYYGQRASAGLIITENTVVAPNGTGILHTPGIYNEAQKAGWKAVTDEVHAKGGKIFMQLVHGGRIGHALNNDDGLPLVAPTAIQAAGVVRIAGDLRVPMSVPEELSTADTKNLVTAFIKAAERAIEAGMDGVEIHAAHGYLIEQFLHPHTNHRTDEYGGSIINRSRFLLEIVAGVVKAIGKERTGIRLSPFATLNDQPSYEEEEATHLYLADALQQLGILYVHISDQSSNGHPPVPVSFIQAFRKRFRHLMILAGGYTAASAEAALQSGLADLIAFGRPFIANPDLVERFQLNAPLATGDASTFYEGGNEGYIDYPTLQCATV
ncbi:alkene reductase [Chitinophaga vietnamensis]|uniref:alkene reductase n=1 Tax=Chitinophaga vietnamensis TaxID=2593957 RepID=UPI001178BBC3|nr:alkene reductase [Chitinophaga vietnamensis]